MSDVPLPNELIFNILSQVSAVKDLLRFRCVSKSGCDLISDSYFVKRHLQRSIESNANLSVILSESDSIATRIIRNYWRDLQDKVNFCEVRAEFNTVKLDDFPFKSRKPGSISKVFGSCNGLVCLSIEDNRVAIWNPSTRKSHELPDMPTEFSRKYTFYGFGYDHISDDYKVLGITHSFSTSNYGFALLATDARVYSLKTNSWAKKSSLNFPDYQFYEECGTFNSTSNALHWIMKRKVVDSNNKHYLIGAFHFGVDNVYHNEVQLPDYKFKYVPTLGNLRGCLCIAYCDKSSSDVWVMKEYGVNESWTRLISIASPLPGLKYKKIPLAYSRSGDKVLLHDHFLCKLRASTIVSPVKL